MPRSDDFQRAFPDRKGIRSAVDTDCDGRADSILYEPNDRTEATLVLLDSDDDGRIDVVIMDSDHDGQPEAALYDTDRDGKVDITGYFRPGEREPYRYERTNG